MREITYQLRQDEILEAWTSAHWKAEMFQKVNQNILLALSVVFAVGYCLEPGKLYLILGTAAATLFLFYYAYIRTWTQRRKAAKMERKKGTYKIRPGENGIYAGDCLSFYDLRGKKWEFLESEHVYTLKIDREIFCIPKRAVSGMEEQLKKLQNIGTCSFHKVITERKK